MAATSNNTACVIWSAEAGGATGGGAADCAPPEVARRQAKVRPQVHATSTVAKLGPTPRGQLCPPLILHGGPAHSRSQLPSNTEPEGVSLALKC